MYWIANHSQEPVEGFVRYFAVASYSYTSFELAHMNNFGQEQDRTERYGHGTCTILQLTLKWLHKFSALKCKRTWQGTVPETSVKLYGIL